MSGKAKRGRARVGGWRHCSPPGRVGSRSESRRGTGALGPRLTGAVLRLRRPAQCRCRPAKLAVVAAGVAYRHASRGSGRSVGRPSPVRSSLTVTVASAAARLRRRHRDHADPGHRRDEQRAAPTGAAVPLNPSSASRRCLDRPPGRAYVARWAERPRPVRFPAWLFSCCCCSHRLPQRTAWTWLALGSSAAREVRLAVCA